MKKIETLISEIEHFLDSENDPTVKKALMDEITALKKKKKELKKAKENSVRDDS